MFQFKNIRQYQNDLELNKTDCFTAVEHYLKKIENAQNLNAFVEVFAQESILRAKQLDEERKNGKPLGLLHGVIVAIKE